MKKVFISSLILLIGINFALAKEVSHNPISKVIQWVGGDRLTKEMSVILSKKPFGVFTMKKAFDKANLFSTTICDVVGKKRHSRDEVDAIRHFIGSTILSAHYGESFTRALLTAHEDRGDEYNDENYMDLANNETGISQGINLEKVSYYKWRTIGGRRKKVKRYKFDFSLEYFTRVVSEKLETGDFSVLESGDSSCARPSVFPNM